MGVPQPEEIYELTRQEGERRLQRPFFELMTTAFAAGFDIAAGLTIYALVAAALRDQGSGIAHLGGSLGFGAGFASSRFSRSSALRTLRATARSTCSRKKLFANLSLSVGGRLCET